MNAAWLLFAIAFPLLPHALLSQNNPPQPQPIPMPADRAAESYRIYSSLIPLGETAGKDWPHSFWLVRNATITAVQPNQPCRPVPRSDNAAGFDGGMNPHTAVHPTADRAQDFAQILEDFDAHCHDSIVLSPTLWQTSAPVHLLTPAEQKEYEQSRFANSEIAAKYKGAPALYGFSEVYFNLRHTVALVYATHWCGGLCGQGMWMALALQDGHWKPLHWPSVSWIS